MSRQVILYQLLTAKLSQFVDTVPQLMALTQLDLITTTAPQSLFLDQASLQVPSLRKNGSNIYSYKTNKIFMRYCF